MNHEDSKNVVVVQTPDGVKRTAKGTFAPGSAKIGGRVAGAPQAITWNAREEFSKRGVSAIGLCLDVVTTGLLPITAGEDPANRKVVSTEQRCRILMALMEYVYPKLSSTQVTGNNGGPVQVLDVVELMKDESLLEAAQKLALGMARADTPPDPKLWSQG